MASNSDQELEEDNRSRKKKLGQECLLAGFQSLNPRGGKREATPEVAY